MSADSFYRVHVFALSDVGQVRRANEDSFVAANLTEGVGIEESGILRFVSGPQGSLFAVADGMGGAAAGETASKLCLQVLYDELMALGGDRKPDPDSLEKNLIDAVGTANRRVFELSRSDADLAGMGTTLTVALELRGRLAIGQVGDSRAYLIRDDTIRQLTRDQSLVAQRVHEGEISEEEARNHPQRNILLQALGVRSTVELGLRGAQLRPYDVLLLCSDGLHSQMSSDEILDIVLNSGSAREACRSLVDLANERGGPDNITAVLIEFVPDTDSQ